MVAIAEEKTGADFDPLPLLVTELKIAPRQIMAVARLIAEGSTIPFIARYRKEATGNLDEVQIGKIQEGLNYYRDLEDRRQTILKSIEDQGKMTDELKASILKCTTKTVLEDLYLPYKPRRRTRAQIAREKGLEPLALLILGQAAGDPAAAAKEFVNAEKKVADVDDALAGARDIVAEIVSEKAEVRSLVRNAYTTQGVVVSTAVKEKTTEPTKFEQYYDFKEKISEIPSHRYLAIRRGENEGVLRQSMSVESEPLLRRIEELMAMKSGSPFAGQLKDAIEDGYKRLIAPSIEIDVAVELKMKADRAAVEVFATNLRSLLLSAPLGTQKVIGIDPGLRTGCKCAVLDETGKFLETITVFPSQSERQILSARMDLMKLVAKHKPYAIAIGNGTAGRETEAFVRETLAKANLKNVIVISVNESGASVYSASEIAREEFPDLDLTIRGAISIGRRLQDPLAELVKIDPKAIGVGQYQHDVYQQLLHDKLEEVMVSCVNHVGVELNTASAFLLSRVAGVGPSLAKKLIAHRDKNGVFKSRKELLKVAGLGPKAFEQAAGFLRIRGAKHPLDASAVHPERYELVEKMAGDLGVELPELVGKTDLVDKIDIKPYITEEVGEPTLRDIIAELKKPGRDPRATFEKPCFREDVTEMEHLKAGMDLEGIVTNVAAFGAFVDIGVHQDGLIHISELSDKYVTDPSEVVKTGDRIKVRVLTVDLARKRISLTAKTGKREASAAAGSPGSMGGRRNEPGSGGRTGAQPRKTFSANPFANL